MSVRSYWYTQFYKQIYSASPAYGGWKASGGDSFKIALCPPSYIPNQDTHVSLNDIIQVSGQGYTSGGQALTGKTISTSTGSLVLGANSVSWEGCVFTTSRAVIYDDTNTSPLQKQLVRWIEFDQNIQLAGDTIEIVFDGQGEVIITPPAGDTTPPVLDISSSTVDGQALTLVYNELLDTSSVPATSDFTVMVNAVSRAVNSVSINSFFVSLILATPVISTDTVVLSYVVPTTGFIRDLAFNPAAAITSASIANITTPEPPDPPPVDVTPPVVAITFPADTATISDTITVTATATDANGVVSTVLYVDGTAFSTDTSSPYSFGLDTTTLANGAHTLIARAIDPSGNIGVSATINVTVSNVTPPPPDITPPSVTITSPQAGAFLAGNFTVAANVTDNVGVVSATLYVDGVSQGVDASQPYSFTLNTAAFSDGPHNLVVTATDAAANIGTSSTVSVSFDNSAPTLVNAGINGTSLTLTYTDVLNSASVPSTSDFSVQTNVSSRNLNSVAISSTQVLITLSNPVMASHIVTISYTAGANPIENRAGTNAANLVNQSVTNTTPGDTTPPQIVSLTVNAASLVILYNETLDTGSVPATSAFAITVNSVARSVSSVAISAQSVTLTLSSAVISTNIVNASYTQPTTNTKIRDVGQNFAASFFNLPVQNITPPAPPPEPPSPALSSVSAPDAQTLIWNNENVANENGYDYETSLDQVSWTLRGTRPADTITFTWTGAVENTLYYMRVGSFGPSGTRYYSNVLSVTTPPGVPPPPPEPTAPTLTSVSAPISTSITWNHTNVSDEFGYEYQVASVSAGPWIVRGTGPANSTTFTWTQATQSTTYFMRVASFGAAGTRYPSNVLSVTTPATPIVDAASFVSQLVPTLNMAPGSSQNVSVTMRNDGTGSWTSAGGYHLYSQNPAGTTRWGIAQVPVSGSVLPNGNSVFSFSIAAPTSGNATVSWDANTEPDLAGYKVYYGTSPGVYGAPIDVGNVTSYIVTGLTAGVTYYFAVSAYDTSNNESALSTAVTLSTLAFPFQWRMRRNTTEFGSQSQSVTITVSAPSSSGNTYFISPTGTDSTSGGSQVAPWRTFDFAMSRVNPGDTLVLRNGTYTTAINGNLTVNGKIGTISNPIRIRAENERQAFIDGNGLLPPIRVLSSTYIEISGIRAKSVDNINSTSSGNVIFVDNSPNTTWRRMLAYRNNRYRNGSIHAVENGSHNALIEECEYYSWHRNGIAFSTSNNCIARRCYANSRDDVDIAGGYPSAFANAGDAAFSVYPGSNCIFENCIAERCSSAIDVQADGTTVGNRFLGIITLTCDRNGLFVRGNTLSTMARDTIIENLVAVGSRSVGLYLRGSKNTIVRQATVINGTGVQGIAADVPSSAVGDGLSSVFITNALSANNIGTGFYIVDQSSWSLNYCNSFGNSSPFFPAATDPNITNELTTNPNFGGITCWVPAGSPMKGAGSGGADIGANVLYRYENGTLTTQRLWGADATFPHGAIVNGINDASLDSAVNVNQRLNVTTANLPY